ncbi:MULTISPECIES: TonB-dependent siderophore receptor [Alkalimonas]|uniref:TonB-dependent siderophore receptor n=1 Tax=Alkalimonas mucilaginosa TaxID=3057676 RepID=A0ABU7JF02_9GAMM|nr:TonB-dependent siderophore receptor [Alkalimonas sp. MEB004]MEE2024269.1 TonB-dependent siderophore receptor [Alkalimonas sp. MEB004]
MPLSTLTQLCLLCATAGSTAVSEIPEASLTDSEQAVIEHIRVYHRQAYRGDVPLRLQPQAVETINLELLTDTGISSFQQALDLSGSIARQNNGGGLWDSFSIRGFPGNENMPSGYLVNGFNAGRGFSGNRDLSNIEYIEIMKGPGSALFGRSEPGGTVNIITKKPQFEPQGYLLFSAGKFDQYRLEGDYTNGVTDQLAIRLNGAVQDYGSFRDFVGNEKTVFTPSISYRIHPGSTLNYEFEYLQQRQLFDRGVVVLNNDLRTLPRSRYLGEPDDGPTKVHASGHQLTLDSSLWQRWTLLAGLGYRTSSLQGYSSDAELAEARQSLFEDGETLTRQRRYRDYDSKDLTLRFELSGNVQLAGVTHHLLLGTDAFDYSLYTRLDRFRGPAGSYSLNIYQPIYGGTAAEPVNLYINDETQRGIGLYLQDHLAFTERWHLSAGLRLDRIKQQLTEQVSGVASEQQFTQFSPRFGLVYQYSPHLTFYSNYAEGFVPLSGTDFNRTMFEPEQSESLELGAKFSLDAVQGTITLFQAEKSNILTSDPLNATFQATLGRARSSGIEIDLHSHLSDSLYADFSYAYMDTHTVGEALNPDWGSLVPAGSRLVNVPKHNASLVLTKLLQLAGKDSKAGIRLRFVSSRLGDSVNPDYQLPSFTLLSLFASSELSEKLSVQLNINNLFDRHYVHNSYNELWTVPGEPLSYQASLRYQF